MKYQLKKISMIKLNVNHLYVATAKTIFFRRQAEKSLVFLQKNLQKPTFCRIALYVISIIKKIYNL